MIYRLDADTNGTLSIQQAIDQEQMVNLPCSTFEQLDRHRLWLQQNISPGDWVILDTLSTMLETTRADRVLGSNLDEPLWEASKVNKYFGDKEALSVYRMSTQLNLRALKNLRARGARILCLCHEADIKDPMAQMKLSGPEVNPAMVGDLIAASSCVFRLTMLTENRVNPQTGEVLVPEGTRVLYLRRTDSFTAKYQADPQYSDAVPRAIIAPTMQKIFDVLHSVPDWVTVYGFPGVGKTTLGGTLIQTSLHATQGTHV
ncbi:MAG: hypothetical protein KGL39_09170 [Patescibacteria group bacterium]|nr:hypothetical protein [Patescibacteria group bacterium]